METMNQVVTSRISERLQKGYQNANEAFARLQAEGRISKDFIFEVGTENKGIESRIFFHPDRNNNIGATFNIPNEGLSEFRVNMHAVKQVAEKLNIPGTYLTSLLLGDEWQKTLGYKIMNTHNDWTSRNRVLVRAVGDEVRAFLSDQYRRLDSDKIFAAHVEEIYKNGAQLSNGYMDDTRIMIESLIPQPIEIRSPLNGSIFLAFGTRLSTSDYGDGALQLNSFVMQGICLNGMVRESIMRTVHLGSRLNNNLGLSEQTYELDSKTTASAVKDLTKNLFSTEIIKERMLEVEVAAETRVDIDKELANIGRSRLYKGETEEIGKILMKNNPEDGVQGEATLWKLTQGITAYANRDDVAERRRQELQEIAGSLFNRVTK